MRKPIHFVKLVLWFSLDTSSDALSSDASGVWLFDDDGAGEF